jgi:hypothetical protein
VTQATFFRRRLTALFTDLILGWRPDLKEWLESIDAFGIFALWPFQLCSVAATLETFRPGLMCTLTYKRLNHRCSQQD